MNPRRRRSSRIRRRRRKLHAEIAALLASIDRKRERDAPLEQTEKSS